MTLLDYLCNLISPKEWKKRGPESYLSNTGNQFDLYRCISTGPCLLIDIMSIKSLKSGWGLYPPHPKFCLPFELTWLNSLFCLWVPVYQLLLTSVFLLSRVYEMEENKHSEPYSLFFFSFLSLLYHFQAASLVLYSVWSQHSVSLHTYYRTDLKHSLVTTKCVFPCYCEKIMNDITAYFYKSISIPTLHMQQLDNAKSSLNSLWHAIIHNWLCLKFRL